MCTSDEVLRSRSRGFDGSRAGARATSREERAVPDIPTSVLLGFLALCWLVVLVPMVVRSREPVPETDDGARGFRVLRRSRRRRAEDDDFAQELHEGDGMDARYADDDLDRSDDRFDDASSAELGGRSAAGDDLDGDVRYGDDLVHDIVEAQADWEPTHHVVDRPLRREPAPRPHRAGRGGFDPEHAAATAAYRFRRRRTVSLVLLLLTVVGAVVGQLLDPRGWIGTGVFGVALVAYLAYLSRQARIEREIRERRMARLRRAREIHPPARRSGPVSPYRPVTEDVSETAVTARVPVAARRPGVVVDLDDDDPAFDDLEYYEPVVYRRAAGQ